MNPAHLHLLLNHLPVIGAPIGVALLAYALYRRNAELTKVALGLFVVLSVAAVATYFTGEGAEEVVESLPAVAPGLIETHEEMARVATIAFSVIGVAALALLVGFRRRSVPRRLAGVMIVAGLLLSAALAWTANAGGRISHSEIRSDQTALPGSIESRRDDGE